MLWMLPVLFSTFLAGCKHDSGFTARTETDVFYQESSSTVDILWVVDNSMSMVQEQDELAARFQTFIDMMDSEETGIDFHIGVVTTDMDDDNPDRGKLVTDAVNAEPFITRDTPDYVASFQARVRVGDSGSSREQGLEAAWVALTEPMASGPNAGFLREDAVLSIIFVSDEDDCSDRGALPEGSSGDDCYTYRSRLVPIKDYVTDYRTLKQDGSQVVASGIVGPEVIEGCENTWPGTRYKAVAESLGGVEGSICEQDFSGIMGDLGLGAAGIRTSFQLSYSAVEETIEVWVDEAVVGSDPTNGWTYDMETDYITFNGTSVPPRDSTITITYEIAAGG